MTRPELVHLELLAEVDSLSDALTRWVGGAPNWRPADTCQALVRRLLERTDSLRVRLEAPLVVATLGGAGTGKSSLINALVGEEVTRSGRSRPTTRRPALVCRSDLTPQILGIDAQSVDVVHCESAALADLVLIDCPDPDTTEDADAVETNLARLRRLLPQCDVLLVTTTQQKYRSARVADELATAAPGARLVFVQTHADTDEDIRDDWREILQEQYAVGHLFLVDSLSALSDARQGLAPRGQFAELVDLLTRQLAGAAAGRIRRANHLDLVDETLRACQRRIDDKLSGVETLQEALATHRARLAARLADRMRVELLASRRQWENRLIGRVASRWGLSPFSFVLRCYQGLGGLLAGSLLLRARSPAQVALWGAMQGARSLGKYRGKRRADQGADRAVAAGWDETELREAALVVDGYTAEAGLDRDAADLAVVAAEATEAGRAFVDRAGIELDELIGRVAKRHGGWFTRLRYELLLVAMLGLTLYRPAKNFFWDSWLAPVAQRQELYHLDFYLVSAFWLLLGCGVLLWFFTGRLRRGLRREINQLADTWRNAQPAAGIFARLGAACHDVRRFRQELDRLQRQVTEMREQLALPDDRLGIRR